MSGGTAEVPVPNRRAKAHASLDPDPAAQLCSGERPVRLPAGGTPASAATTLELAFATKINASRGVVRAPGPAHPVQADLTGPQALGGDGRQNRLYHSDLSKVCCYRSVGENVG